VQGLIAFAFLAAVNPGPQTTPAPAQTEQVADGQEKIVCKRFAETGSLVRAQRVCKSKRDWDRDRAVIRSAPGIDSCSARANGGQC